MVPHEVDHADKKTTAMPIVMASDVLTFMCDLLRDVRII